LVKEVAGDMKVLSNVKFLEVNEFLPKEHYSNDGLHLNIEGKRLMTKKLVDAVWESTDEEATWTGFLTSETKPIEIHQEAKRVYQKLRISSLNIRSLKRKRNHLAQEIELHNNPDVIILIEHWLNVDEVPLLSKDRGRLWKKSPL
jgi:hypothetical protein